MLKFCARRGGGGSSVALLTTHPTMFLHPMGFRKGCPHLWSEFWLDFGWEFGWDFGPKIAFDVFA